MEYLEAGEIVSVHGVKGEVKIYPWADYPEFLEEFDEFYIKPNKMAYKKLEATQVRCHKNMVIAKFEGYDTPETSRNLIGKTVYIDKSQIELEEGTYFVADLIGCTVINAESEEEIGQIKDVANYGASDIYTIEGKDNKEYLFPAVEEFIVFTDIEKKEVKIKVIEGMFSEN